MTAPKPSFEKVTASMTLPLPSGVELKVKKGQKLEEGQVIARRKASSQIKSYHLSKLIGASPKRAIKSLVKKLGEEVKEGDLVAQKKSLLGKGERFIAPVSGILDSLTEEGVLRIRREVPEKEVKAPFAGIISEASASSVSLSFAALEIKGSWGGGKKVTGYLTIIEGEEGDLFALDGTCEKQIIALQGELPKGLWYKAVSLGAVGFVAGGIRRKSLKKEIEEEEDSLPVVILGEDDKIREEIWQELRKAKGKMVLVDGHQKRVLVPH